jgi:hypothetical protein
MSPQRVGSILLNADELVAEVGCLENPAHAGALVRACVALGVIRNDYLIGGVVYHGYVGHECQVSIAVDRTSFMPWRALFDYPFNQLGCVRLTALIGRKNRNSRALCRKARVQAGRRPHQGFGRPARCDQLRHAEVSMPLAQGKS